MHILILNWRDPKSPLEGGAERFTQKYAEFWASEGHKVTWLTNSFFGSEKSETIKGVEYKRIGPKLDGSLLKYITNYPLYLLKSILFANNFIQKNNVDVVIDEIHGLPFFSPFFSKKRNILLVCEVAGPIWDKMFPFPLNIIGKNLERIVYSFYRSSEIWAISENTKNNITELLPEKKVTVIDLGIDDNNEILDKISNVKKTTYPSAIFLARIVKMKGIETAIKATVSIVKTFPNFKLFVAGDGDATYIQYLQELIKQLKLENNIEFLGKVSELDKFSYLKKAHFLFHPSYKEGFGLTVLEAGLVGTPTLARKGSGMDYLIKHGYSGFLYTQEEEIENLTKSILQDNERMSQESIRLASKKLWPKILEKRIL